MAHKTVYHCKCFKGNTYFMILQESVLQLSVMSGGWMSSFKSSVSSLTQGRGRLHWGWTCCCVLCCSGPHSELPDSPVTCPQGQISIPTPILSDPRSQCCLSSDSFLSLKKKADINAMEWMYPPIPFRGSPTSALSPLGENVFLQIISFKFHLGLLEY